MKKLTENKGRGESLYTRNFHQPKQIAEVLGKRRRKYNEVLELRKQYYTNNANNIKRKRKTYYHEKAESIIQRKTLIIVKMQSQLKK